MMSEIHVKTEEEAGHGWRFEVEVRRDGVVWDYEVTLSWADYDLWGRGQVAPERVVKAAFEYLLSKEGPGEILPRFDCAVIRKYFKDVDKEMGQFL